VQTHMQRTAQGSHSLDTQHDPHTQPHNTRGLKATIAHADQPHPHTPNHLAAPYPVSRDKQHLISPSKTHTHTTTPPKKPLTLVHFNSNNATATSPPCLCRACKACSIPCVSQSVTVTTAAPLKCVASGLCLPSSRAPKGPAWTSKRSRSRCHCHAVLGHSSSGDGPTEQQCKSKHPQQHTPSTVQTYASCQPR